MRWGIKTRLFVSMLILAVLPLVLSGWVSYSITCRASLGEAKDKLAGMPGPAGRRLEEMLYFRWNDTLLLSRFPVLTEGDDPAEKSAYLREILRLYAPYSWLGVTNAAGRIIAATDERSLGREVAGAAWVEGAKAIAPHQPVGSAVHVQDVYASELSGGLPVIGFSAPLYDGRGRFRGVVHTEVRLSFAAENVEDLRAGRNGSALLVDRNGRLLADRNGVALERETSFSRRPSFRLARSGRSHLVLEKDESGEEVWTSFAPLRGFSHYPGLGWSLLVFQPAKEVDAAAGRQARLFAAITLACIAGILLGGYFLLERWISRPVARLCGLAERIGAGDWDQRAEIGQGGEIGRLAASFDRMADDLRALQQRLAQATLREFSFEIAHELGNPLAALLVGLQVLEEEVGKSSPYADLTGRLLKETLRIDNLVQIFLSFARPQQLCPIPCDLKEILDEVLTLIQEITRPSIYIRKEFEASSLQVSADPVQIQQALLGLLWKMARELPAGQELRVKMAASPNSKPSNKRKTPEGPSNVTVTISCPVQIFSPAQLRRISSPLFDLKPHDRAPGLAFVRQIIEQHGGRLSVESDPAKGSQFTLHLPVHNA